MTLLSALDHGAIDRRLAHHQCVWCGTPLHDQHPSDEYCCSEHQVAWHRWTNGHPLTDTHTRPSLIEQMTHEYEQRTYPHTHTDQHTD
jgi:hypothetical protein